MITQVFTLSESSTPLYGEIPLCGGSYRSGFNDKFRLSPKYDKPKEHEWTLSFDNEKVPAFTAPQALIILDGDVRIQHNTKPKLNRVNNVLVLPSDKSPEQFLATFLHDLSDKDKLWAKIGNGYTCQVCFRDYPYDTILSDRNQAKKWFISQKPSWGKGCSIVLKALFEKYPDEKVRFQSDFEKIHKLYKH